MVRAPFIGIAQRYDPSGRHSIGNIEEAGGMQLVKIAKQLRLNQLGVQLGHSVDGMASYHGEVRHPYRLFARFLNDRETRNFCLITRILYLGRLGSSRPD
jgi:hypothetical protein